MRLFNVTNENQNAKEPQAIAAKIMSNKCWLSLKHQKKCQCTNLADNFISEM